MRLIGISFIALLATSRIGYPQDVPLVAGRDVERPARTHYTQPDQSVAQSLRIMGLILFELTLDREGNPADVKILRSIPLLDPSLITAALRWRYAPTIVDGEPRRVRIVEGYEFLFEGVPSYDYANLAKNPRASTDLRLYAIWQLQQLPPKKLKGKAKTLQKLEADDDPLVATAATAALATLQSAQ